MQITEYGDLAAVSSCGGKAEKLLKLRSVPVNIPDGFILTYSVFEEFKKDRSYIDKLSQEILTYYNRLIERTGQPVVAIRSSVSNEDSVQASFAGLYQTYINVDGAENLIQLIKKCMDSFLNLNVNEYFIKRKVDNSNQGFALIVQSMVIPNCSGVMFTKYPFKNNLLIVESNWGLAHAVVSGKVTPDRYEVDLNDGYKVNAICGEKEYYYPVVSNNVVELPTSSENRQKNSLSGDDLKRLVETGLKIEKFFGCPQDIEWTISDNNEIVILQSRPITLAC